MYQFLPDKKLDEKAIAYERTKDLLQSIFTFILAAVLFWLTDYFGWPLFLQYIWGLLPAIDLLNALYVRPELTRRSLRYRLNAFYLDILTGFFFKKRQLIPVERIQQVQVTQGPLERKFQVASVKIFTAGTTHEVPLLLEKDAELLRQQIIERVKVAETDV